MIRLDYHTFIEWLKITEPKTVLFTKEQHLFGSTHHQFHYEKYLFETQCYDCRFRMDDDIEKLGITVIEDEE